MSFLHRSRAVAPVGYNRWWVALGAVCGHLSIGQLYAFSVFNLPLTRVLTGGETTVDDWTLSQIGWTFGLANALAGLTAAVIGSFLDRLGPRLLLTAAALFFGGGFVIAALGVATHQIALLYLGYGVIGGIGIGLAYITPVATLIKWFPNRPGLASGLVIMGFGAGAIIGAPRGVQLMALFQSATDVGVVPTFLVMGAVYCTLILLAAFLVRVPPPATDLPRASPVAMPAARASSAGGVDDTAGVTLRGALHSAAFYLLWVVLFLNVTAGIAVISQASAMVQELVPVQGTVAMGTLFVTLLSVGNMVGRIGWSSVSDVIGRRRTFAVFFMLGAALYATVPFTGFNIWLYMICYMVIISMYGGGFATIPAYVKDVFGPRHFASIYGPVLTAWSAAGLAGPALLSTLQAHQAAQGVDPAQAYANTMHLLAVLLLVGMVCNLLVHKVLPAPAPARPAADVRSLDPAA